jgi:hypothetical protein
VDQLFLIPSICLSKHSTAPVLHSLLLMTTRACSMKRPAQTLRVADKLQLGPNARSCCGYAVVARWLQRYAEKFGDVSEPVLQPAFDFLRQEPSDGSKIARLQRAFGGGITGP